MTLTNIDRCRLEHAARTIRDVSDWLHDEGILGRESDLRSVYKELWDVILEDDDRRAAEILAAVEPLRSLDKACNFCMGTGIREACDHELKWACRDCNAGGLQSEDARKAGAIAIANNLRAVLAAFEPFRVTLAPEIGDTRVIRSHEFTEAHPCFRCGGTGIIPNPPGVCSVFPMECPDCQQRRHAAEMLQTTLTAEQDPFRVLGSCPAPAPQVDVIDGETA